MALTAKKISDWYDWYVGDKLKGDYERERWQKNPKAKYDYLVTADCIKENVLPLLPTNGTILEIGCGVGTWTKFVLENRPDIKIVAIDISEQMIISAKINSGNQRVRFIVSDWLEFKNEQLFDGIFSVRAFEYFSDKKAAIEKMFQAVNPGAGIAIITKQPHYMRSALRLRFFKKLHCSMLGARQLKRMCRQAGFTDINIYLATIAVPLLNTVSLLKNTYYLINKWPKIFLILAESYLLTMRKKL
jgi:trans-aconitate methyltransferase